MNGLSDRVDIVCGDARLIKNLYEARTFDAVVSNPPYRKLHSGRINPDGQKALARHEIQGTLDDFLMAAAFVLKKSGRVFLIYPAARLVELMARMRAARLEPKRLRLIHSKPGMDGDLVLVEGLKDGREDLHILPPLFVYGQEGQYTEEMGAIFAALSRPAFP
jgi:tRNA1Val (adenine37-N6)-methyltransferase